MYQYQALASGHIRIVTLRPGLFEDDVSVILREEKFQPPRHVPQYEAVSYAWDERETTAAWDERETTTAWVLLSTATERAANQVTRVTVTRNLDLALRHLRYAERSRDLWVDKICIDQQNIPEKGRQVKMMGEIYSLATRVLVFLGPEQDQSPRAMGLLDEMGSQVDWDPVSCSISPAEQAHDKSIGDMKVDLPYDVDEMTCL
ncbi:heterokaryon incompatibility protein-domain-containing protein [Xylaria arbuscula]|nr:heterokaryon incompatibility protein-domain-containing protein [Xylaria arbuscula]